ncbi:hypothetical protein D3C72_2069600 [compost metagenome]
MLLGDAVDMGARRHHDAGGGGGGDTGWGAHADRAGIALAGAGRLVVGTVAQVAYCFGQ